jgi:hypothetical protein
VDWYKSYQKSNVYNLCREQITAYTALAGNKKRIKTDNHKLYEEAAPTKLT